MPGIEDAKKEYDELLRQLSDPGLISDFPRFEALSKRKSQLEKIIEKDREIQEVKNKIEENKAIISAKEDAELSALAEGELTSLKEKEGSLEKEMSELLAGNNEAANEAGKNQSVIVEIRAGAGGDEAAIFAGDLFRMYSRYGQKENWQVKILDSHPADLGGYKEMIFELSNGNVMSKMKYEAGVHRVQRIPNTEKQGRIHTSTASVAVLQKPKNAQIKINPQDLKIDFYRSSGKGGQNVNRRETAVRITHLPTGLVVTSQTQRNQLQNKENAMAILEARLLEKKEQEVSGEFGEKRRTQIGKAKRAEKIRTYNFPQDRLTDHRLKKSWHNIEKIMAGDLEQIFTALAKAES
jgi:peptide chain release factor 1